MRTDITLQREFAAERFFFPLFANFLFVVLQFVVFLFVVFLFANFLFAVLQFTVVRFFPPDAEWRKAFAVCICNVGSQLAECIHQQLDGTLLHAGRSRENPLAGCNAEVSRQKAHRRACCQDIDGIPAFRQRFHHHPGVVAVRQVFRQAISLAQRMDDEGTVADTF